MDELQQLKQEVAELKKKVEQFSNPALISEEFLRILTSKGFMRVIGGFGFNGATGREFKSLFVEHNNLSTATYNTNKTLLNGDYVEFYKEVTANVNDTLTSNNHGYANDDRVYFYSTGELPTPLTSSILYYVINASTNTFKVSVSSGGAAVNITDVGTGIHYVAQQ
jgi:hypothetical protein